MDSDPLPRLDEHATDIDADADDVWTALGTTLDAALSRPWSVLAALVLGCADTRASGPRPLTEGSALPGFRVAGVAPGALLALEGQHRYSTYALVFRLEWIDDRTRLRAESRAIFTGAYRLLVVATGAHRAAVRRLLAAVKRRAERWTALPRARSNAGMENRELLLTAFDNIEQAVRGALEGIEPDLLIARVDPGANTIAWLVWHLTRIQDDHVADVAGRPQAYRDAGWADRFGLPFDVGATGYGFTSADVAATRITDPDLLLGYHAEVHRRTAAFVSGLSAGDLDRIVDERWDPPVTLGVRLVSVVSDDLQHAGQAAFVRGVLDRR